MSWVLLANELATKNDVVAAKAGLFRLWGVGGGVVESHGQE